MFRRRDGLMMFGALIVLGLMVPLQIQGDTYSQSSQSSLDDIMSVTEATTPATRDRTTIGIGEQVTCSIDPNTWRDQDCNITHEVVENDTIGTRTWETSGSGGTVYPTSGDSTTLTASMTPAGVTVSVNVNDSQARYSDAPIIKTKTFSVIAPSSASYQFMGEFPEWVPWTSGTKYLAAQDVFEVTINPTTVSFYRANIQANFGSGETDTWPDGSTWHGPTGTRACWLQESNVGGASQISGLYDSNKLYTGSEWQDFSTGFSVPLQYQDASSNWVTFNTATSTREYFQSDRSTRLGIGGVTGGIQGPKQDNMPWPPDWPMEL